MLAQVMQGVARVTRLQGAIFVNCHFSSPTLHCPTLPSPRLCQTAPPPQTFASLMRNCQLTSMGNPVGRTVVGKVYHVVGEDLYIDFGHKFGCVCTRPREGRGQYMRGTEVLLRVKSLEQSERFLGYDRDLSLLEADCVLLGINK
eukprot:GFUD01035031.1.p1 GENE.GFUD01035031.1~~GFUD01035031.1.p1  ORF type:complete len:145 (+),score=37.37 GFUD01035031.1:45-479(+)